VQWIIIPLQIGDPTCQVARVCPHPGIAIADTVAKDDLDSWKTAHPLAKVTQEG